MSKTMMSNNGVLFPRKRNAISFWWYEILTFSRTIKRITQEFYSYETITIIERFHFWKHLSIFPLHKFKCIRVSVGFIVIPGFSSIECVAAMWIMLQPAAVTLHSSTFFFMISSYAWNLLRPKEEIKKHHFSFIDQRNGYCNWYRMEIFKSLA